MQVQWVADRARSEAVDALYGSFQNVFLHNPHLFRVSGNPPKVSLVSTKAHAALDSAAEDELLSVATSVTSQLFSRSPDVDSPSPFSAGHPSFAKIRRNEDFDEKDVYVKWAVERLKKAPDNRLKRDELGSDLVKNARKLFDQITELWGSLQEMLSAYPDLFLLEGDIPGSETVTLREADEETQALEDRRLIVDGVKSVLKRHYSQMHPDDLREELHQSKPMLMGRISTTYGGFSQLLSESGDWLEVVDAPQLLTPPSVRLRWPAFCAICGMWPETPEAWQAHVFSEKHKDMRRSVVRLKDGRDPDRWPVLRMIEERIRRAGGKMKLSVIPAFGKNRPLFATYVRKLYGGFRQLVESNPRFKVVTEDNPGDPWVHLVDNWRADRLEGVVIRVKQKDTLIWIRPDTNPNIEFFLHKDRSLGGREIANSPAFVVPRVGDRMSFCPSDVPADPNPFAEGAVVLESVPDLRLRFQGTVIHHDRDRFLLRAEFQTAAGPQETGNVFEVIWRDDMAKMAINAGQTRVNFVRSCRPPGTYPYADDVTVDSMPPPRQQQFHPVHYQQHHAVSHMQQHVQQPMPMHPNFTFTSDATYRGRPAAHDSSLAGKPVQADQLSVSTTAIADARSQRSAGRFGTWPVVVFDPTAKIEDPNAPISNNSGSGGGSGGASADSSGAVSPPTPRSAGGSRKKLQLNPSKPIVEFSFRPSPASSGGAPSSERSTSGPLPSVSAMPSSSHSAPSSAAAASIVLPEAKEFQVSLQRCNDEEELRTLLVPGIMELLDEKAPDFARTLVSVAMDVGSLPVLSFSDGSHIRGEKLVTSEQVKLVVSAAGNLGPEGSSVVGQSLHLCSTIVHPISREIMGVTIKVGRAVIGLADILAQVVKGHASVLVLGEFCTGKTVLLRDLARRQSEDVSGKLVAVVDATGELGGAAEGRSHAGLGSSRCVRCTKKGHLPDAVDATVGRHGIASVVVDGVCTAEGVGALLRTRRRGVGVICSIGAASLAAAACDEVFRPMLSRQPGGRKTANVKPPFDVAVELHDLGSWIIHHNINASCDALLNKHLRSVMVTRVSLNVADGAVKWVPGLYPESTDLNVMD